MMATSGKTHALTAKGHVMFSPLPTTETKPQRYAIFSKAVSRARLSKRQVVVARELFPRERHWLES